MKSFYRLFQYEFSLMMRGTLLLALGAAITPWQALRDYMRQDLTVFRRYEHLFDESGALIYLLIYFAALLALFLKSVYSGYWGGKSIYTMLTLPVRRESLYFAKLSALAVSMSVLWAAASVGIWLGFELINGKVLHATSGYGFPDNGMFLGIIRSNYLSLILPLGATTLLSTISILAVVATGIYYAALCERSKRYWGFVFIAAAFFLLIRVLAYRLNLPITYLNDFRLGVSSLFLLAFALWFVWHSIRLVKRGVIV